MNPSQAHLHKLLSAFGKRAEAGGVVLDAGAGSKPYRHHFSHLIYESADLPGSGDQTYECDLHSIPVSSERYDLVTCNQVLEHVKKPFKVMKELKRVCKPGGYIFYSIPFYYVEHMIPYDYYRYTSYGSRFLAERVGFEIVEFGWLDSFVSTVSFQLAQIKKNLPSLDSFVQQGVCNSEFAEKYSSFVNSIPQISSHLSSMEMQLVERELPFPEAGHPLNYYVVAKK